MTTNAATFNETNRATRGVARGEHPFSGELYRYHGFRVFDSNGERVGIVDWIWTDEARDQGDHIGLRLQWLRGKACAVPATGVVVDRERGLVLLAFSKQQIANAPRFRIDRALTGVQRSAITTHFTPSPIYTGSKSFSSSLAA